VWVSRWRSVTCCLPFAANSGTCWQTGSSRSSGAGDEELHADVLPLLVAAFQQLERLRQPCVQHVGAQGCEGLRSCRTRRTASSRPW
jgi:hypothetical protein